MTAVQNAHESGTVPRWSRIIAVTLTLSALEILVFIIFLTNTSGPEGFWNELRDPFLHRSFSILIALLASPTAIVVAIALTTRNSEHTASATPSSILSLSYIASRYSMALVSAFALLAIAIVDFVYWFQIWFHIWPAVAQHRLLSVVALALIASSLVAVIGSVFGVLVRGIRIHVGTISLFLTLANAVLFLSGSLGFSMLFFSLLSHSTLMLTALIILVSVPALANFIMNWRASPINLKTYAHIIVATMYLVHFLWIATALVFDLLITFH